LTSCSSIAIKENIEINENEDWLIIGANTARTNISKSDFDLNPPFDLFWEYDADAGYSSNCLSVSDGVLFASTLRGEIFALNIENGKSLGRITNLGKGAFGTPAIYGKGIIVTFDGDKKNSILSYNIEDGIEVWSRDIGMSKTSPVLYDDKLLVSSVDNKVYSLNRNNGKIVWTYSGTGNYSAPKAFYTSPTIYDSIMVIGNTNGSMYALDMQNGRDLWEFKTDGPIYADASIDEGKIFFGSDDNNFYCLSLDGKVIWKKGMKTSFKSSSSFYKDMIIISAVDGYVYALDKMNGDQKWRFKTNGTLWASPVVHKDKVFIGSFDMNFYCLDANTGNKLWNFVTEGRIRSTAVTWKNFLFVASEDKNIYCFKSKEEIK
jgi:outer membrane protein assembly factor BamB